MNWNLETPNRFLRKTMEKHVDLLIAAGSLVYTVVNGLIAYIRVSKWNDIKEVLKDPKETMGRKVDEAQCLQWRKRQCRKLSGLEARLNKEDYELGEAVNRHSHEWLPGEGRVVR